MKILALEFSSKLRSVALMLDGELFGESADMGGRSVPAFEMIDVLLKWHRREDIECLAIGLGPGSYAGIRVAIALAQGWQLARPIKLVGIGSVECLALEAQQKEWFGLVNFVIDAQRNEFYLARYEIGPREGREIAPLKLATRDEITAISQAGGIIAGPETDKWFAGARPLFPSAAMLGMLAEDRTDFVPGEKLEPIYLRETSFVKAPSPRVLPAT